MTIDQTQEIKEKEQQSKTKKHNVPFVAGKMPKQSTQSIMKQTKNNSYPALKILLPLWLILKQKRIKIP